MSRKDSEFEEIDLPELDYDDYGLDDPQDDTDEEDVMMDELSASLGAQVNEELSQGDGGGGDGKKPKKRRRFLVLKVIGAILG
ncbi:MAG: hypothetical protein ILP10_07665, partial [Lachnospiraceae bacterium]|nr:hypothetical protein [Lachnospiraceae bacterium]